MNTAFGHLQLEIRYKVRMHINQFKSRMSKKKKKTSPGQILILNFTKIQRKMILMDPITEYKQRQFIFSSHRDFKMNGKKKNI
jgi:hypothetical protein